MNRLRLIKICPLLLISNYMPKWNFYFPLQCHEISSFANDLSPGKFIFNKYPVSTFRSYLFPV